MEQKSIKRMPTHCGDNTCPSCVTAGDYIYLAHHAGGHEKRDIKHQTRAVFESIKNTLAAAGATLDDMVQIHLYLYDLSDFDGAIEVFNEYFDEGCFPARMTTTSKFLNKECLVQIDGIAYKMRELC